MSSKWGFRCLQFTHLVIIMKRSSLCSKYKVQRPGCQGSYRCRFAFYLLTNLTQPSVVSLPFGRGSRVTSRGSRVNGRGSRVTSRGSRVTSRGSKNSSQLFLNVGKSKFRVYSSFQFLFVFFSLFQALANIWFSPGLYQVILQQIQIDTDRPYYDSSTRCYSAVIRNNKKCALIMQFP